MRRARSYRTLRGPSPDELRETVRTLGREFFAHDDDILDPRRVRWMFEVLRGDMTNYMRLRRAGVYGPFTFAQAVTFVTGQQSQPDIAAGRRPDVGVLAVPGTAQLFTGPAYFRIIKWFNRWWVIRRPVAASAAVDTAVDNVLGPSQDYASSRELNVGASLLTRGMRRFANRRRARRGVYPLFGPTTYL